MTAVWIARKHLKFLPLILIFCCLALHESAFARDNEVSAEVDSLSSGGAKDGDDKSSDQSSEPPVIKFLKVKNRTALVSFSKNAPVPKVGQIGQVVPRKKKDKGGDEGAIEGISRGHFIALASSLSSLSTKSDGSSGETKVDAFDSSVVYGWNKERIEYGVILKYSFAKYASTDSKTLEVGVLGDYNFGKNVIEKDFVTGLRIILATGQIDNSGQKKAATTMTVEPGFFIKWFGLSPNLAGTLFLSYRNQNYTLDSIKTTTSGFLGSIGIQAYF